MNLPRITVVLFTYAPAIDHPRHQYALDTLRALCRHLRYEGDLRWHIADDGSPPEHVAKLRSVRIANMLNANQPLADQPTIGLSNSGRRGYGASYNAMTAAVHDDAGDLVLCMEDDWFLLRPLDLTPLAAVLATDDVDCIRLGYLGWTHNLRGRLIRPVEGQTFLLLDPESEEKHVFSGGPRLETVAFERALGTWPEGVGAGHTELQVCGRPESRHGVAWPLDMGVNADVAHPSLFAHIGGVSIKDAGLV